MLSWTSSPASSPPSFGASMLPDACLYIYKHLCSCVSAPRLGTANAIVTPTVCGWWCPGQYPVGCHREPARSRRLVPPAERELPALHIATRKHMKLRCITRAISSRSTLWNELLWKFHTLGAPYDRTVTRLLGAVHRYHCADFIDGPAVMCWKNV